MPLSFPPLQVISLGGEEVNGVTYEQRIARDGKGFRAYVKFSIPSNGTFDIRMVVVGNAVRFSRTLELTKGNIEYTSYRNAVLSGGTLVTTSNNLNDTSLVTPNIQFYTAPTVTTIGTESDFVPLKTDTSSPSGRSVSATVPSDPLRYYTPRTFLLRIVNKETTVADGVFRFHFGNLD